ncbi:hypothetical protein EDB83DRAFT_2532997 [Lactarius deliciosus]|nr:hypothetical protein EDB83DRAFT_2532997 [Lactarius deliciosus]
MLTIVAQTLTGPTLTPFTGDRALAQQFLDEFWQLERANLRHVLITHPALRVELALSFIHGPLTDLWKQTVQRGSPGDTENEELWDEFYDSFCTAWTDDLPVPVPQTPSPLVPVNASAAQRAEELQVITTPVQTTAAPSPNAEDDFDFEEFYSSYLDDNASIFSPHAPTPTPSPSIFDLVCPVEEPVHLSAPTQTLAAPSIALPPLVSTPQTDRVAQRVEKRQRDYTSEEGETRPSKYPRPATHAGPPRASPQLGRRSVPLPRKYAFAPRRATSAPVTSVSPFIVPYSPPPRRPPSPPGDPTHNTFALEDHRTIVKDDNMLTRGVKTLDDSVFAPVSAQDAVDSPPQTPPHAYLFPRHAFERPRDPDELATKTTDRQRCGNARSPYPATPRNHDRHARQARPTTSPKDAIPTPVTPRTTRRRRRATAAAHSTSPQTNLTATRLDSRPVPRDPDELATQTTAELANRRPLRANAAETTPRPHPPSSVTTHDHDRPVRTARQQPDRQRNCANAVVEMFLAQYDAARTTPVAAPSLTRARRTYDAVMQHLDRCRPKDPDTTGITQPFALKVGPSAILRRWKTE